MSASMDALVAILERARDHKAYSDVNDLDYTMRDILALAAADVARTESNPPEVRKAARQYLGVIASWEG